MENPNILEDIQAEVESERATYRQKKERTASVVFKEAINSHNGVLSLNGRKLHPDLVPVFTGSKVTSYKLKMPSYSKEFALLARNDVERYQILTKPPQIRFIPDEELLQDNHQSTTLKSDTKAGEKSETYKMSYEVFEDGSIKPLIRFFKRLRQGKVRETSPTKTAPV